MDCWTITGARPDASHRPKLALLVDTSRTATVSGGSGSASGFGVDGRERLFPNAPRMGMRFFRDGGVTMIRTFWSMGGS